jgi:hypothetical protein
MESDAVPRGTYEVWGDDDEVIGLTVARSYPKGMSIVRTDPPTMDAIDEAGVALFLAWCLTNAAQLTLAKDPVLDILERTAAVNVTVCPRCGGAGTVVS